MTALAESAILRLVNTSTTTTSAARDAGQKTQIIVRDATGNRIGPGDPDYDMMKAKQESRERRAAAHLGLLAKPAHTPEPWHHSADLPHHGCRLIRAADGYLVADAGRFPKRTGHEMDSNARRIVSCVNACEGMTDPAAEIAALRAALAGLLAEHDEHARSTPDTIRRYHDAIAAARKALAGKGGK